MSTVGLGGTNDRVDQRVGATDIQILYAKVSGNALLKVEYWNGEKRCFIEFIEEMGALIPFEW